MVTQQTTMTVTKQALIVRIPWDALVQHIKPKPYDKIRLTIEDVLRLVEEGRHAHRPIHKVSVAPRFDRSFVKLPLIMITGFFLNSYPPQRFFITISERIMFIDNLLTFKWRFYNGNNESNGQCFKSNKIESGI